MDLPDLIGHPAFPTSMEGLVAGNGGTVMDAARAALERDEVERLVVTEARLLATVLPSSLRSSDATEGHRPLANPGEEIPWPAGAGWLEYVPKIAAVVGRGGRNLQPDEAAGLVFGYTLVNDLTAHDRSGNPGLNAGAAVAVSLGPCIVTADEIRADDLRLVARVDGETWAAGPASGAGGRLCRAIAAASRSEDLRPGDVFATGAFQARPGPDRSLWPGALIELAAEGVGVLGNRVGPRA